MDKDTKVKVVKGCYCGKSGKVVGAVHIPILGQNLYSIVTDDQETIKCPADELEIIRY